MQGVIVDSRAMPIWVRIVSIVSGLACLAGCQRKESSGESAPPAATAAANAAWPRFVDDFIESYFVANPAFAVGSGRHEFDGKLPDWSRAGIENEIRRLEALRKHAEAFENAALLPPHRFQRDYLISVIDKDLFWLKVARSPFKSPTYYFGRGLDPSVYIAVPYAPAEQRLKAFIAYLRAVPAALAQIRETLEPPLARTHIEYAIAGFGGFADFYRTDGLAAFADVQDVQLKQELADAAETAARAMQEMRAWMESLRATAHESFALGPERFAQMLEMTERVTTPLERLEQIGQEDLERNLQALEEACSRYLPNRKIEDCIARIAADKSQGGPVQGAREQLARLKQFLIDRDLVSIPGDEEALVDEAPPYQRQNSAYIIIPGPYDKGMPSIYYIAPPDPSWSKAEREAYIPGRADLLFVSIHEVWPGHFLHFLHANRASWRFGQLFVGYAFAEGWAHYTEELMVEQGLADSAPELHVAQLTNALLRNVRYLCAIGLHTKNMSVAECERMFREKAYQDAGNARQQAARGTYDPAYLNYTLGKLIIRKLRSDWMAERGGSLKAFHDELLSYGGPPLPLVRAQMLRTRRDELL
jgi:uncharacterized protein (DUF885 family)